MEEQASKQRKRMNCLEGLGNKQEEIGTRRKDEEKEIGWVWKEQEKKGTWKAKEEYMEK